MAENRSQHFVPRFYLENFSFDGGARFHLFRLAKQEVRKNVGIRDQCAANYFYGKDLKIEKTFMRFEGAVSAALRQILSDAKMPKPGSDGDLIFRTHVALQWGRTRAHSERVFHVRRNRAGSDFLLAADRRANVVAVGGPLEGEQQIVEMPSLGTHLKAEANEPPGQRRKRTASEQDSGGPDGGDAIFDGHADPGHCLDGRDPFGQGANEFGGFGVHAV
jgi:hypothetical protein